MTLHHLKMVSLAAISIAPMLLTACATTTVENDTGQESQITAAPTTIASGWTLRLPEEEKVLYKGVVSLDGAGGPSGPFLYPAPNVVGFVAAVITHGVINESVKSSQKSKLQEVADKVLVPYQPVLSSYGHKELMQRGLEMLPTGGSKKLAGFSEKLGTDWSIESTPVFFITQDQSAIILENAISIYAPGSKSTAAYQSIIRIVSHPKGKADLTSFWTAENGKTIKEESAELFAESLNIALNEVTSTAKANSGVQKTYRYLEGNIERMERGQLISEQCGRIVIKTLRGMPMSIPARRDAAVSPGADQCARVSSNLK